MPTQAEESIDAFQQYYRTAHEIEHKASFKQFFWDPVEKKVLGRTGKNWSKYIISTTIDLCMFFASIRQIFQHMNVEKLHKGQLFIIYRK